MMSTKVLKSKSVSKSLVETNHIVLPSHTNALGGIFGGMLVSWIDITAAICAQRHCGRPCVTASIDALHFLSPAKLGDVVNLKARVIYTGSTSLVIRVEAITENPRSGERKQCCTADLSFVALDSNFKPSPVPSLKLRSAKERKEFREAEARRRVLLDQLRANRNTTKRRK